MTNGDYIRSLSDERLALFLQNVTDRCYENACGDKYACDMCMFKDADCNWTTSKGLAVWLSEERKND